MSAASDLLLDAHRELIADGHGSPVTAENNVTRQGIVTPAVQSDTLRKSGQMLSITQTVEIEAADLTAWGLTLSTADRALLSIGGQIMKIMVIEHEPADPCILLHLKPEY